MLFGWWLTEQIKKRVDALISCRTARLNELERVRFSHSRVSVSVFPSQPASNQHESASPLHLHHRHRHHLSLTLSVNVCVRVCVSLQQRVCGQHLWLWMLISGKHELFSVGVSPLSCFLSTFCDFFFFVKQEMRRFENRKLKMWQKCFSSPEN